MHACIHTTESSEKENPVADMHPNSRDNARIRICNSVAVKHGREIQAPLDRVTFGQTMQDFPKTLEELRSITQEKRVALLANFDVDEREALEMGEEAGMLALEVWSGCTVSLDG